MQNRHGVTGNLADILFDSTCSFERNYLLMFGVEWLFASVVKSQENLVLVLAAKNILSSIYDQINLLFKDDTSLSVMANSNLFLLNCC